MSIKEDRFIMFPSHVLLIVINCSVRPFVCLFVHSCTMNCLFSFFGVFYLQRSQGTFRFGDVQELYPMEVDGTSKRTTIKVDRHSAWCELWNFQPKFNLVLVNLTSTTLSSEWTEVDETFRITATIQSEWLFLLSLVIIGCVLLEKSNWIIPFTTVMI